MEGCLENLVRKYFIGLEKPVIKLQKMLFMYGTLMWEGSHAKNRMVIMNVDVTYR